MPGTLKIEELLDACRVDGVVFECGAPLVWVGKLDTEELVGGGDLFVPPSSGMLGMSLGACEGAEWWSGETFSSLILASAQACATATVPVGAMVG
jgi:hypothetical protein